MTLEKALYMIMKEYEQAKKLPFVRNPLAYAIYKVWKKADKEEA